MNCEFQYSVTDDPETIHHLLVDTDRNSTYYALCAAYGVEPESAIYDVFSTDADGSSEPTPPIHPWSSLGGIALR